MRRERVEARCPRAVAYERSARDVRGRAGDLGVGHAQQHGVGSCAVGTATPRAGYVIAGASERGRERGTHAAPAHDGQARTSRGVRGRFPFQFPHLRYRSAAKGKFRVEVRPRTSA